MELIEREALRRRFENYRRDCEEAGDTVAAQVFADCIAELEDAPTIDATQVVHGRWICDNSDSLYKYHCSVCKKERHSRFDRYCSYCGCKMKENK